ncbi:MAG: insulinase family protein [bacterium]|nr:insulinase family protein [bacterium]
MSLSTLLLLSSLLTQAAPVAQETRPAHSSAPWGFEESDVKVDPRVHFSNLPNGIRIAWAHNAEPKDRIYVRLHVNVGSLGETESERGMAHFLEHMAFNGSDNFASGTLIEWFQNHGMGFGADTNAHTAFSETVYKLDLPGRDEKTLREGLVVMRDFAGGLLLADEEVQSEKGVIDGEERERDSAGFRAFVQSLESQYAGTRLPNRIPIGTKEARDRFNGENVRAFYERWYRPENMTVVLVGDLQELNPEAMIAEIFGDFKGPGTPVLPEPDLGKPTMKNTFFSIVEKEIPYVQLVVSNLKPHQERPDTIANRRRALERSMAHSMLALRFSEAVKRPETAYLQAQIANAGGMHVFEGGDLTIITKPDQWSQGLTQGLLELRQAQEFGFQQSELDEIRAGFMRQLEEGVDRQATADSHSLLTAILTLAEKQRVPTDAITDLELIGPMIEKMTLEDCHRALLENWDGGEPSMVAIGSIDLVSPKEQLLEVYDEAFKVKLKAPVLEETKTFAYASNTENISAPVKVGRVEDMGLTQVEFANGVRLNIKATDFKERQILMRVRVGDGRLAMNDGELAVAKVASDVFIGGGLVEHSADELRRIMAGRQVHTSLAINDDHLQFNSATTREDLLRTFELTCAYMSQPGYRSDSLIPLRAQLPPTFEKLKHEPSGPIKFELVPAFIKGNLRANLLGMGFSPSLEEMLAVDMEQVQALLTPQLTRGAIEMTIVGDVDVKQVITLASQTFGSLPKRDAANKMDSARAGAELVSGLKLTSHIETKSEKATLVMLFPTDDGRSGDDLRRQIFFLGKVVDDRLRLEVRERLGAAYSPFAVGQASRNFEGVGAIMIQASGNPAEIRTLVAACEAVGVDLAKNGVTQEEADRLAEPIQNTLRDMLRTNGYWLNAVDKCQKDPSALGSARNLVVFYAKIDAKALSKLAAKYLMPKNATRLVVMPKIAVEANANK